MWTLVRPSPLRFSFYLLTEIIDTQWAYLVGIRVSDDCRSAGAVGRDIFDHLGFRPEEEGLSPHSGWKP